MEPATKIPIEEWNSKKLRAIVQHCGFLSKYDSPLCERENCRTAKEQGYSSWWKMMYLMKVILKTWLSGRRSCHPNAEIIEVEEEFVIVWLPFSSFFFFFFFYPPQTSALRPMWTRELWSPQNSFQHVASGCSKSLYWGAGWYEGNPPALSHFRGWGH